MDSRPVDRSSPERLDHRRLGPWLVLVGLGGGLLGMGFIAWVKVVGSLVGPDQHPDIAQIAILGCVGLVVGVATARWGTTGGVDLLVDNIHVLGGPRRRRGLRTLLPSAILGIAAGGAVGPEAPLVETTGSAGTAAAEHLGWGRGDVRVLTITGMAAGFAVLFGAPIGAAVFALEILHRDGLEYYEALIPSLVGGTCGLLVYEVVVDRGIIEPIWDLSSPPGASIGDLGPVLAVALAATLAATVFVFLVRGLRIVVTHVPTWSRPAIGGVAIGALALWTPYALTIGEVQLPTLLASEPDAATLATAGAAKLLACAVCVACEWKGGFIIPLFFVGATIGQLSAHAMDVGHPALVVAAGMVATCVAVTKTPLGSTLVVAAMTGLALTPLLLVAALTAFVVGRPLTHFSTQRHRSHVRDTGPATGHADTNHSRREPGP